MNRFDYMLILLATAIVLSIIVISPRADVVTNGTTGEIYGVDIFGLTRKAQGLPDEQFAAH